MKIAASRLSQLRRHIVVLAAMTVLLGLLPRAARAQLGAAPSDIVINAATGEVLAANHPDELRFPASLTKLMTLYLTFRALRDHRITLGGHVPVSAHAASQEPVKLWLDPGMRLTVQQCILAMVTRSANDAASAMAERLGGSESRFARMMTSEARALGMRRTVFRNASGLPDPGQVTTARDMATLARALMLRFPEDYHYFSVRGFRFRGRVIRGHDPMLGTYPGVDGLKTGYTSAAGFNMVTSAVRGGTRVIAVVLGEPSDAVRDTRMASLLDEGFTRSGIALAAARPADTVRIADLLTSADAAEPPPAAIRPAAARASVRVVRRVEYGVQVGSFASWKAALHAVRHTVATVGGVAHVRRVVVRGRPLWQARVASLTRSDALRACPRRERALRRCFLLSPPRG